MKRFIVTEEQLNTFVETKKAEKIFYQIVGDLYTSRKNLNENLSLAKHNQTIIDNYRRKNLVTPKVDELLIKRGILDENRQII